METRAKERGRNSKPAAAPAPHDPCSPTAVAERLQVGRRVLTERFSRALRAAAFDHQFAQHLLEASEKESKARLQAKSAAFDEHLEMRYAALGKKLRDIVEHGESRASDQHRRMALLALEQWSHDDFDAFAELYGVGGIPSLLRIGTLLAGNHSLPAAVSLIGGGHVAFVPKDVKTSKDAAASLSGLLLRIVAMLPPGACKLHCFDPVGLGESFIQITRLPESIIGKMILREQRQWEDRLEEVTHHTARIIQQYLRDQHADITAWNRAAKEITEPYQIVAIANYPVDLSDRARARVHSLIQNGPRCGVHLLLTVNPGAREAVDELNSLGVNVLTEVTENQFNWCLPNTRVILDSPPNPEIRDRVVGTIIERASKPRALQLSIASVDGFRPSAWRGASAAEGIAVPIGRQGADGTQHFELGGVAHHALLGGGTGSGKSVFLHALICSAAAKYSPHELEFYLVDFKGGVEFKSYAELPHARVVLLEAERELALNVLKSLDTELRRRWDLVNKHGVSTLAEVRGKTQEHLPRVLFIADEFQGFFSRSDWIAHEARRALDEMVRLGRSVGIHVLLATQSLAGIEIEASTLTQLQLRIALRMAEHDALKFLGRDNVEPLTLRRAGEGIYNDAGGQPVANRRFQTAFLPPEARKELLHKLQAGAAELGFSRRPYVFDGSRQSSLVGSVELARLLAGTPSKNGRVVRGLLGEPLSISEQHLAFKVMKQSRVNLLVVGQEEMDAFRVVAAVLLTTVLALPASRLEVFVLNLTNADSDVAPRFDALAEIGSPVMVGARPRVDPIIARVHDELTARHESEQQLSAGGPRPTMLLCVFGLQRASQLARDGAKPSASVKKLQDILSKGPDLGIHTLLWADTVASVGKALENRDISEFDARVVVTGGDATRLLGDNASHVQLRRNYGAYYNQSEGGKPSQFRIYDDDSISALIDAIRKRAGGAPDATQLASGT
jgi:S-DNA-T family DNA segregation ATPase FtsK/SpoIIIE